MPKPQPYKITELSPADTAQMLKLRNATFGNITEEHWRAMDCTAAVAKRGQRMDGAIPLQFRQFVIKPGCAMPVVFENAVGVRAAKRSTGIGGAMIESAATFMADRVDALFVYRGGERSDGYRFYRKTGHGDLYFVDRMQLAKPRGRDNDVEVLSWEDAVSLEAKLLPIFRACYGKCGGFWRRDRGFFKQIITSHVYKNDDCRLLLARRRGRIDGYAITNPQSRIWGGSCLYDFAAPAPAVRERLLEKLSFLAAKAKVPITIPANPEHPLYDWLLKRGFEGSDHGPYIMARIIRPDRAFARLAERSGIRKTLRLEVQTPHRTAVLNDPARPRRSAVLYMKESHLSRLLCCRLDFESALRTNLIRSSPLAAADRNALARVFRFSPWVTFGMDYV